ncbi:DNA-binding domain-containing protein [Aminicella lysinilytica]|uniref:Stage 0 sporulation protein A homolog n=1 Tax=Aminicella lysinilytica TaxID=433323 RepID=A0A4R6PYP8_9FIRM|nr:DNA-binding domain-containing protein [Aminicella lysinilytica]TDP52419.1 two-component system response regulator YcbB [Aminicella lysinilytica]
MKYYIVDDNIGTVKTLENIIRSRGIGSVCGYSTDPDAAIGEILEDKPDIVLVDLLMGGIDGITMVNSIKAKDSDISFVMISKVMDKEMIQKAYTAGVEFFINKPINIIEVEKILGNVSEKIKMKSIMSNIRGMFEGEARVEAAQNSNGSYNDINVFLSMLGMQGENGTQDVKEILKYMVDHDCGYDKKVIESVADSKGDTVKNVEQRVRRAIKKGLTNAANAGLDDYGNEVYSVYANYVFDFKCLKDEMNYLKGKGVNGGRVSISKFMEGLHTYYRSLK